MSPYVAHTPAHLQVVGTSAGTAAAVAVLALVVYQLARKKAA